MDQPKRITKTIWIVAILFVLVAAAPLYADSHKQGEKTSTTGEMSKQKEACESTANEALLLRATDLIGSDVKVRTSAAVSSAECSSPTTEKGQKTAAGNEPSPGAERIGTVKELVICDNADKVGYVILTSQNRNYPIPWRAFYFHSSGSHPATGGSRVQDPTAAVRYGGDWISSGVWTNGGSVTAKKPALCLNITKEQLRQAPAIDSTISLEKLADLKLYQEVDAFYTRHAGLEASRMAAAHEGPAKLLKASKIRGLRLQDSKNEELGKVRDLLIDVREGHLAYGLVSFGGFMGIREKTAAVPWSALNIRMEQGYAALNGDRDRLEASVIDERNVEKLAQPEFARRFHDTFSASPYWEVFGFVPGEETPAPTNPWHPDSAYSRTFDPSTLTTIEGTIRNVESVYPDGGAAPGIRLDVEIREGESVAVCAGPRALAAQNGIEFGLDSKIGVTGSKTKVDGQSVIMASEVRIDGKTLRVRDAQGKPEWKIEDLPPED